MKRNLINAVCFAIIALGGSQLATAQTAIGTSPAEPAEPVPAETPYATCMRYCMAQYNNFNYCHSICKDLVTADASDDAAIGTN